MRILTIILSVFLTSCLPIAEEAKLAGASATFDVPFTDIWGTDFVSPGQVSDGDAQGRQLPQRKTKLFMPEGNWAHFAVVIDKADHVYTMQAVTTLEVKLPGLDTVIHPGPCLFYAGFDSYPSTVGYKMWNRRDNGSLPIVRPSSVQWIGGTRCGIYEIGDTLAVRANVSADELTVKRWWTESP